MPSKMVMMTWDDGPNGPVDPGYGRPGWSPVDPGYGRPGWSPVDPGYGHPGGPHISHGLPGGPAHVGGGPILLPVWPFDPTVTPPIAPTPTPTPPIAPTPPPNTKPIEPGARFILKCTLAFGLILVPDAEPKK